VSHVEIEGVKVWFHGRDIRLANDAEMEKIRQLVKAESGGYDYHIGDRILESVEIVTDYLGPGMRYHTTTRVSTTGVDRG
jgi:hypothetical protein